MQTEHITHPFSPVWDQDCTVLILGSFPSVKSRENDFYYGHPQNRFWKVIAAVCGAPVPRTIPEKRDLLLQNHIALWDVVQSCEICGSNDSSIRNVEPTDLRQILSGAPIRQICANGGKAAALYRKHQQPVTGAEITALPSTSPANAVWSLERLTEAWSVIKIDQNEQRRLK